MKIKMLVGLQGPNINLAPKDEPDFPDAEALRLIAAGHAVPVSVEPIETATRPAAPERRGKRGAANVVSGEGNAGADD